jgi:hypothetical protein
MSLSVYNNARAPASAFQIPLFSALFLSPSFKILRHFAVTLYGTDGIGLLNLDNLQEEPTGGLFSME